MSFQVVVARTDPVRGFRLKWEGPGVALSGKTISLKKIAVAVVISLDQVS